MRISYLDYARVLGMYLVILGHLYNGDISFPHHYIYAFHMPLFFIVSGMLHKESERVLWKKYLKTLIVPFVAFNFLWICFFFIGLSPFGIDINAIFERIKQSGIIPGPTWFLLSLFYCRVILDYSMKYPLLVFLLWLCCFLCLNRFSFLKDIWLAQAIMAMPFYYIGCRNKETITRIANSNSKYSLWGGVISLVLLLLITTSHGRVSMKGVKFCSDNSSLLLSVPVFYINAFCGSFMILFFSALFKPRRIITDIAKALITILCVQYLFIFPSLHLFGWNASLYVTIPISIAILILSYLVHIIIAKYCPFIIGKS